MELISGIVYNFRGLMLGLKTPRLLALGLVRFAVVLILTILSASLILAYQEQLTSLIWNRPQSPFIQWLWVILSWLVSLLLIGLAAVASFLSAQLLFGVLIMDMMSRITERMIMGEAYHIKDSSLPAQFLFLIRQEVPRSILPVLISILLMMISWLTPLGPAIAILTAVVAAVFLAWDNTDLIPARRLEPFGQRFGFLLRHLCFHVGFGLWFLIPVLNILFLSYAPVGATLYHIEKNRRIGHPQ